MKKMRGIVIVLVLLAVLIGAYEYIKLHPKQEETKTQTQKQTINLATINSDDIVKLELISDVRKLVITKENESWILNGEKDTIASQNIIKSMTYTLADISANQLIEKDSKDLSVYGLDKPKKLVITLKDNTSYTLYMGNATPTADGYYLINGENKDVYMVAMKYKDPFNYTYQQLVEKETITNVTPEKLNYVYIAQKGRKVIEAIKPNEGAIDKYELWNSLATWKMTNPYFKPRGLASNDAWTALVTGMTGFNTSIRDFIVDKPSNLAVYGLDKPELELLFKDSDGVKTHLYFGSKAPDGTTYFMQEGSTKIYTVGTTAVDVYKNVEPFSITDKFAMIFSVDDVSNIVITKGNEKTEFGLTTTKSKDDTGKETSTLKCVSGGKEYPEDDFKKLYQNLVGVMVDSEYKGEPQIGTPDISMKFTMTDGKVLEAKYYKYNDNYYIFDKNGTQEFIVGKRQFDSIFERIKDFFDGSISNK
jgi:hypothetical protein